MSRPFAVFDIDGTIIRWQLYHALADELVRTGHLDSGEFQTVREARMNWKKRHHDASYLAYERILIDLFEMALTDISQKDLQRASQAVIGTYKEQVYTYTRDMIADLRAKNYLLFAISASQDEMVKTLANYYGFDDAGGSKYEVKDGYFTGKVDVLMKEKKPEFLKQLVDKHDATWEGSIAVGDSENDILMLEAVEQPIAFNPTKQLFEHAGQAGWPVVVERKNMIYELEPQNGSYLLAPSKT
jgi:HAD superfamily hydrolase (TIGR01490 family)